LVPCEGGVCVPVTGADFTWEPETPTVGEMVTFTAMVGEGTPDFAYTWDFGDGIPRYGEIVYYTFSSAGTYNVTLTASNCDGGATDTESHLVTVSPQGTTFTIFLPLILK
jgi:PKD repeat protein